MGTHSLHNWKMLVVKLFTLSSFSAKNRRKGIKKAFNIIKGKESTAIDNKPGARWMPPRSKSIRRWCAVLLASLVSKLESCSAFFTAAYKVWFVLRCWTSTAQKKVEKVQRFPIINIDSTVSTDMDESLERLYPQFEKILCLKILRLKGEINWGCRSFQTAAYSCLNKKNIQWWRKINWGCRSFHKVILIIMFSILGIPRFKCVNQRTKKSKLSKSLVTSHVDSHSFPLLLYELPQQIPYYIKPSNPVKKEISRT